MNTHARTHVCLNIRHQLPSATNKSKNQLRYDYKMGIRRLLQIDTADACVRACVSVILANEQHFL